MLDEGAAGAMNDALGHAGRAGGVQDVERMVERERLERQVQPLVSSTNSSQQHDFGTRPMSGRSAT